METFPVNMIWNPVAFGETGFKTAKSKGYGGTGKRDSIVSVSIRMFSFPVKNLTLAQAKTVWDFFQARKGGYDSFKLNIQLENGTWTDMTVYLDSDSFTYTWSKAQWYEFGTLKFVEDK